MMAKSRLSTGAVGVVAVFCACATVAQAEFKAVGKASSGASGAQYVHIEAGGAQVECLEGETKAAPEWTIESSGKAAEKGADLRLKSKTWGECQAEIAGSTKAVTSSGCEMEVRQPSEEETVGVAVLSTCALDVEVKKEETCEIKLEAKENKELQSVYLIDSGKENEDTLLQLALKHVATSATGSVCEAAGVKSTKEGTLEGAIEALQVAAAGEVTDLRLSHVGSAYFRSNEEERWLYPISALSLPPARAWCKPSSRECTW
jgi:hypothetical protein